MSLIIHRLWHAAWLVAGLVALGAPAARAADQPLRILIYGGTGRIGSHLVAEGLRRGDQVTVVVRNASHADLPPAVRLVAGNVLDSTAVARQIAGQDVVISAVSGGFRGPPEARQFQVQVAHSLVAALRSLSPHAPRLIVMGGASSLQVAPGKLILDTESHLDPESEMVTLTRALEYYRTVRDVDWTFISPPLGLELKSDVRTGKYRVGGEQVLRDPNGDYSRISVADLAVAVIDEAHHPQHTHRHFTVAY